MLSRELGSTVLLPIQPYLEAGLSSGDVNGFEGVLLPGGHNLELEKVSQAGQLGIPLLRSDLQMVQLKPLRRWGD